MAINHFLHVTDDEKKVKGKVKGHVNVSYWQYQEEMDIPELSVQHFTP